MNRERYNHGKMLLQGLNDSLIQDDFRKFREYLHEIKEAFPEYPPLEVLIDWTHPPIPCSVCVNTFLTDKVPESGDFVCPKCKGGDPANNPQIRRICSLCSKDISSNCDQIPACKPCLDKAIDSFMEKITKEYEESMKAKQDNVMGGNQFLDAVGDDQQIREVGGKSVKNLYQDDDMGDKGKSVKISREDTAGKSKRIKNKEAKDLLGQKKLLHGAMKSGFYGHQMTSFGGKSAKNLYQEDDISKKGKSVKIRSERTARKGKRINNEEAKDLLGQEKLSHGSVFDGHQKTSVGGKSANVSSEASKVIDNVEDDTNFNSLEELYQRDVFDKETFGLDASAGAITSGGGLVDQGIQRLPNRWEHKPMGREIVGNAAGANVGNAAGAKFVILVDDNDDDGVWVKCTHCANEFKLRAQEGLARCKFCGKVLNVGEAKALYAKRI